MYRSRPDRIRETSEEFLECTPNALMIRRCVRCRALFAPPVARCSSCFFDEFEQLISAGIGSVVCWRTVHCAAHARAEPEEATIAIVELDEGPWIYTTIEGDMPASTHEPVRVQFRAPPHGDRFPIFALQPDTPTGMN